jgi:hypothetical protein
MFYVVVAGALLSSALGDYCNCSKSRRTRAPTSRDHRQKKLSSKQEIKLAKICATNDLVGICEYLNGGGDPNKIGGEDGGPGYQGLSLLVSAAYNNSAMVVQRLIDAGADIDLKILSVTDPDVDEGENALNAAVRTMAFETVQRLLLTNIKRNLRGGSGLTPLAYLVSHDPGNRRNNLCKAVTNQLKTLLKSGDPQRDCLIFACIDFVESQMRTYDLRQLVQYEQDAEKILSLVQGAMESSLLPISREYFYRAVAENGGRIQHLQSMFKPSPDYRKETLQLLLADPKVDLAAVDANGNTALHIAAEQIIAWKYPPCSYFARMVELFQILVDNERVQLEVDLTKTNNAGKSVQQSIDEAREHINDIAQLAEAQRAEAAEARHIKEAEERRIGEARAQIWFAEEARAQAQFVGRCKKVLLVCLVAAVWEASVLLYPIAKSLLVRCFGARLERCRHPKKFHFLGALNA